MITLHTLASGSSGNAILLSRDGCHLLVDAGISCRRIHTALGTLGLTPGDLSGILITHSHSDHISGLQTLIKRCTAPVYTTQPAGQILAARIIGIASRLHVCEPGLPFFIGPWTITAFSTSHDSPGSCGFRLDEVGILTDTGYIPDEAAATLSGVRLLVLESNHDVNLLMGGPYPYPLKQRILSAQGHLSNEAAAAFAAGAASAGTEEIVLAHLSQENNTPRAALSAVSACLREVGLSPRLTVAPRDTISKCYIVSEDSVCRK